jgi:hypothetical protein
MIVFHPQTGEREVVHKDRIGVIIRDNDKSMRKVLGEALDRGEVLMMTSKGKSKREDVLEV